MTSNTRRFPITMHRARQLQRGEVMRPGVMLGSVAASAWPQSMPVLPNVADGACRGCGHHKCSCVQLVAATRFPSTLTWAELQEAVDALQSAAALPQQQGARDVRVGDTWRVNGGRRWTVAKVEAPFVYADDKAGSKLTLRADGSAQYDEWQLVSRAKPAQVDDGAAWEAQAMAQLNALAPPAWQRCGYSVRGSGLQVVIPDHARRVYCADRPDKRCNSFADPLDALLWCFGFDAQSIERTNCHAIYANGDARVYRLQGAGWGGNQDGKGATACGHASPWPALCEALGKTPRELGLE